VRRIPANVVRLGIRCSRPVLLTVRNARLDREGGCVPVLCRSQCPIVAIRGHFGPRRSWSTTAATSAQRRYFGGSAVVTWTLPRGRPGRIYSLLPLAARAPLHLILLQLFSLSPEGRTRPGCAGFRSASSLIRDVRDEDSSPSASTRTAPALSLSVGPYGIVHLRVGSELELH
jgi:hypothetical protein